MTIAQQLGEIRVKVTSREILSTEQFLRAICKFFQASRIKNLFSFGYDYLSD